MHNGDIKFCILAFCSFVAGVVILFNIKKIKVAGPVKLSSIHLHYLFLVGYIAWLLLSAFLIYDGLIEPFKISKMRSPTIFSYYHNWTFSVFGFGMFIFALSLTARNLKIISLKKSIYDKYTENNQN